MRSLPLGESVEPAFKRRKNKKHFTAFNPVQLFCTPRDTRLTHETNTHYKRDLFTIRRPDRDGKKNIITMYFKILNHGTHILSHHPRGPGPPPLRNISGGLLEGLSEPPCGLRPCARPPMIYPCNIFPGTQKQRQNPQTALAPISSATANPSP